MVPAGRDFGESISICVRRCLRGFAGCSIERAICEKMPVNMAFPTSERNMLVIYGLNPFEVIVVETYRIREGLRKMYEDAQSGIGGVAS